MIDMLIAHVAFLASCLLFDAGHCARWQVDNWGVWCAEVTLEQSCPFDRAGWHKFGGGVAVCSHGCGEEGPTR